MNLQKMTRYLGRGFVVLMTFSLVMALGSCSKKPTDPGLHSISGHVRLIGYQTAPNGSFLGTRVVDDADGVMVDLAYGTNVVGRVATVNGTYRFDGFRPGGYVARTRLLADFGDQTEDLTITNFDVVATDTLLLKSRGDLFPAPNPFADTVGVHFDVAVPQYVDVRIRDLSGTVVTHLLGQDLQTGVQRVLWFGLDRHGHPAVGSIFWVTFEGTAEVTRSQLLFR